MAEIVHLSEELLIGKGAHKKTYADPADETRCIKIPFVTPDTDLERELRYRRSRDKRKLESRLLTAYFGTVETNLGTGYVFERVRDFDGNTSRTIRDVITAACSDSSVLPFVEEVMRKFKSMLFEELVITSNMEDDNFSIQRISESDYTIRITDNIGSPAFLPLAFYSDYFARRRTKKYWGRFLVYLRKRYPAVMTGELEKHLL